MATGLPDDYEAQQRAAESFQPDLAGPNVSDRLPIEDLIIRYAEGHPAYQQKTQNLTKAYDAYRQIKGDGHCGWRAILFRLVETVIELSNPSHFDRLLEHLQSFKPIVANIDDAHDELYSNGLEELIGLLQNLKTLRPFDALTQLAAFFDSESAPHAIYCMRLIASAHIRSNPDEYAPVLEKDVVEYCGWDIEQYEQEITEIGLRALSDALLRPMGVALEVLNLHTNPGSEIDVYSYEAPDAPAIGGPYTIDTPPVARLLYIPGHYDLIYRKRSEVTPSAEVQINMLHSATIFAPPPSGNSFWDFGLEEGDPLLERLSVLNHNAAGFVLPRLEYNQLYRSGPLCETLSTPSSMLSTSPSPMQSSAATSSSGLCEHHTLETKPFIESHLNVSHYDNGHFQPNVLTANDAEVLMSKVNPDPRPGLRAFREPSNTVGRHNR